MFITLILLYLTQSCNDFSDCLQGKCIKGNCSCFSNWEGEYCEKKKKCRWGNLINETCYCPKKYYFDGKNCRQNCTYGIYDIQIDSCICRKDWKDDSFNSIFKNTKCSQFKCKSNFQCQNLTGIITATCPVYKYNCYCGLTHFDLRYSNVKCMNFLFSIVVSYTYFYLYICKNWLWFISVSLAIISIPFGKRRTKCDHHITVSWLYIIKNFLNMNINCKGSCVYNVNFRVRDDFALSIYWLKTGIWWYIFFTYKLLILLLLLLIKELILIVLLIIGLCILSICICLVTDCNLNNFSYINFTKKKQDIIPLNLYYEGPFPNYQSRCYLFNIFPFKYYPQFPDNLQGGLFGYLIGTHITRNTYMGGNFIIDLFSLQLFNTKDFKDNKDWKISINNYLNDYNHLNNYNIISENSDSNIIGNTHICKNSKLISKETDICWICNNYLIEYHQWENCKHQFCVNCSTKMLELSLPCPLCRNIPLRVIKN